MTTQPSLFYLFTFSLFHLFTPQIISLSSFLFPPSSKIFSSFLEIIFLVMHAGDILLQGTLHTGLPGVDALVLQ